MLAGEPEPHKGAGKRGTRGCHGAVASEPSSGQSSPDRRGRRVQGVAGWPRVQAEAASWPSHRARRAHGRQKHSRSWGPRSRRQPPAVVAVDMAAADIHPGLLLVSEALCDRAPGWGRPLRPTGHWGRGRVRLLPLGLQLLQRGRPQQPCRRAPQQRGPAQVGRSRPATRWTRFPPAGAAEGALCAQGLPRQPSSRHHPSPRHPSIPLNLPGGAPWTPRVGLAGAERVGWGRGGEWLGKPERRARSPTGQQEKWSRKHHPPKAKTPKTSRDFSG